MVFGIVRKANILNFSVNLSTAQRGQTGGRAALVQWDLTEITQSPGCELAVADTGFEMEEEIKPHLWQRLAKFCPSLPLWY